MTQNTNLYNRLLNQSDVLIAVGVILILTVMIIPLPTSFLDLLLVVNISLSLTILLVAMYLTEPLELSVFPGLLLVMTLYRLSLNVASTRLILGDAYAGKVISAFGNFVVKGNYVVGFVIFLILVVIQFVVITKGAGRIAEVAARFTLDAMPGKQMSIDADLNAGLIDEDEARKRRKKIAREADFYGAMDGASKFVRGDAIAGLIITLINILGGFIIGIAQKKMAFDEALQTYTLLTVGDGLVSQIPALIISTAAGIVVTRATSESNLGHDLATQLLRQSRALYVVAGALFFFGLTPGLPTLPFFVLATMAGFVARTSAKAEKTALAEEAQIAAREETEEENIERYLQVDPLEIEIGYSLIPLVDEEQGGDLLHRITAIRKQCAIELGIIIPPIRIRDNISLEPDKYVIKIRGVEVAEGRILMSRLLALSSEPTSQKLEGIPTKDPAFNLPALWIPVHLKDKAEKMNYTVVEPDAVLATHLREVIKNHAHEILNRQNVHELIENVKKENTTVVEELVPNLLTIGQIQKVLQNLLREKVPIRDLVTILEVLADHAATTKDTDVLTEYVRHALAKTIYKSYVSTDGVLYAMVLEPRLENLLTENLNQNKEMGLNLEPHLLKQLYNKIKLLADTMSNRGNTPLILCSPMIRLYFKRLIEMAFPQIVVLSYSEIPPDVEIQSIGTIGLDNEN